MLMQLVCVDRRYQRMNCFNVRELQGNLKRKFFTDLVNSNDHRDFLNQSILGMRFKTNNNLAITSDMEAFYNFGTTTTSKSKSFEFVNNYTEFNNFLSQTITNTMNISVLSNFNTLNIFNNLISYIKSIFDVIISINLYSIVTTTNVFSSLNNLVTFNLNHFKLILNFSASQKDLNTSTQGSETTFFNSENLNISDTISNTTSSLSEVSNSYRFNRFSNPLISYDYKCGHYLGI
jgi:hypothetical protein